MQTVLSEQSQQTKYSLRQPLFSPVNFITANFRTRMNQLPFIIGAGRVMMCSRERMCFVGEIISMLGVAFLSLAKHKYKQHCCCPTQERIINVQPLVVLAYQLGCYSCRRREKTTTIKLSTVEPRGLSSLQLRSLS